MKSTQWGYIAIIIAFASLSMGCDKNNSSPKTTAPSLPTTTISTSKVIQKIADNQLELVGTVEAVKKAEISSKIAGNIIKIQVELGSKVEKGQLLVELSAEEISAQVQQVKAQLAQARRNLAREENLLKKNATTPKTVKSLRDSTRIAEAAYKEVQTMLAYAKINAPFAGIVTRKLGNVGDLATPGKPLLYLEEQNNLQVITDIPEALILQIKKGDLLSVTVPSANLTLDGTVAEVSPIADPSSRSAPIKLRIPPNSQLRSGQFARVKLAKIQAETLFVPSSAIVPFGQMKRVFVVTENKVSLRLIRTGTEKNNFTEILSGLSQDEVVAITNNDRLLDGQPVTVK